MCENSLMRCAQVHQCIYGKSDFVEGIRALLIDKTGDPKWDPPSIEQVLTPHLDSPGITLRAA